MSTKYKLYLDCKNNPHDFKFEAKYKKHANELNNLIDYAKYKHDETKVKNVSSYPNKLWNFANKKLGTKARSTGINGMLVNGTKTESKTEIAEH